MHDRVRNWRKLGDTEPDCHQTLVDCFLGHALLIQKISSKSVHNFLRYFTHKHTHTDTQTSTKTTWNSGGKCSTQRLARALPRSAAVAPRWPIISTNWNNKRMHNYDILLHLSASYNAAANNCKQYRSKTVVTCKIKHLQKCCTNVLMFYFTYTHV